MRTKAIIQNAYNGNNIKNSTSKPIRYIFPNKLRKLVLIRPKKNSFYTSVHVS